MRQIHRILGFTLGALMAAILVQLYLTLFPFYVTHFLNNYTGSAGAAGFAVILLLFLYYFSVILLLGAEINAYFGENIRATPASVPEMIHTMTSHLPTSAKGVREQAAIGHKDEKPKEIRPKEEFRQLEERADAKTAEIVQARVEQSVSRNAPVEEKKSINPSSNVFVLAQVVVGTTLAFVVALFSLRQDKKREARLSCCGRTSQ